jgi:hypothetical protein
MEYGQQAFSAMKAAEAARAAEAAMNEAGEDVASQGDAPDTLEAIHEQEDMLAEKAGNAPEPEAAPEESDEDEDSDDDMDELHGDAAPDSGDGSDG